MKKPGLDPLEAARFKERLAAHDYQKLILIFTEGIRTEPAYFAGFKEAIEQENQAVLMEVIGVGFATLRLIGFAESFVKEWNITGAEIWIVSDRDEFPKKQFNRMVQDCKERNEKHKRNNSWHCAWSNECFELWFVLHFSFYQAAANRFEYQKLLSQKFRKLKIGKYEKNLKNLFEIMYTWGNPREAILFARKLAQEKKDLAPADAIPCTMVFELVEELAGYLPEELQKHFFTPASKRKSGTGRR